VLEKLEQKNETQLNDFFIKIMK